MKIKYLFALFLLAVMAAVATPALAQDHSSPFVDPELANQIKARGSANMLIYMRERADLSPAFGMGWEERGQFVYKTLKDLADRSQAAVRAELDGLGVDYRPFWIDNVIAVADADAQVLNALTSHSEIQGMIAEPIVHLPDPQDASSSDGVGINAVTSSVEQINAPDAWAAGYTGQGAVVGIIDSGTRYTHEALVNQYRGNLGGGTFDHNYNWFDIGGSTEPQWPNPHGTHVTGTAIGDNGTDQQIGVAPGADWISCLGCTSTSCPGSNLLACGQFMAAPTDLAGNNPDPNLRADVVNNSWGDCGTSYDGWYQGTVDAWIAAGVVPMVSNGNAGNCGYSYPPGLNTVGNPARYGSVLGIGSSGNNNGLYANHSNWGPTDNPNDGTDPTLPDPMGYPDLKPNVVAPGVGICSSVSSGDSSYSCSYSGTSMSSPSATGVIALMISAAPSLKGDFATLGTILMETANPIPYDTGTGNEGPGLVPNYATGWGEIDAFAAVQAAIAASGPQGTLTGTVTDQGSGLPISGAEVTITNPTPPPADWTTTTDASGQYTMDVPTGTYDVDIAAYGYQATTLTGVVIDDGQTTIADAALTAATDYQVSGAVTDSDTGWPLHAQIDIAGYPNSPLFTDPSDGSYSVTLPEGMTFEFTVTALSGGYDSAVRSVGPLTAPATEDFALDADLIACEAPGYDDAPGILLNQSFDTTSLPTGWSVVDNAGGGQVWVFDDPGNRGNLTGGSGGFAIVDSDDYGSGSGQNTELVSPSFDLSGEANAELEFKYDFRVWSSPSASVDVSTDGGTTWTTEWSLSSQDRGPATATVSLLDYVGNASVQVRFVYVGSYDWWWQVDDVSVTAFSPCSADAGEILTGVVSDTNSGSGLNGATVAVDSTSISTTTATSPDPAFGDGTYHLFVPAGSQTVRASETGYSDATLADTFTDPNARRVDFSLDAGRLAATPESLSKTVTFGDSEDGFLILVNEGSAPATVNLSVGAVYERQDFETSFPPAGWTVDNLGGDCDWVRNDDVGRDNHAGGDGFAAIADSDDCGSGATMDTALVSPAFPASAASTVDFVLAYNNLSSSNERFDVEVSDDGGTTWTVVQSYNADVDPYGPGAPQSISLGAYDGSTIQVRFRYVANGWYWFVLVDQVELTGTPDWLSITPDNGTFDEGPITIDFTALNITPTFDAGAPSITEPGTYNAEILVENDTPYGDIVVPVEMNVTPAADQAQIEGTITSLGYCDSEPQPLAGADVEIVGQNSTFNLTADANGHYEEWLDVAESPVVINVTAAGHISQTISGVALSGGGSTTQDVDLRLEAACPDVAPDSLTATHLPGESSTQTITLSNTGTVDLNWTTDEAEPNVVNGGEPGNAGAGVGQSMAGSASDLRSLYAGELPTIEGFARINAIDCETADFLVVHDDGSIENGYTGNASVVSEVAIVEYFEPATYPAMIGEVCISFLTTGPTRDLDFELVVFADDGPGGAPGTELGAVSATAIGIPGGGLPSTVPWFTVDVSSLNIELASGGLYFGARYVPVDPGVFISSDESTGTTKQLGWFQTDGGAWDQLGQGGTFDDYRAMFIRPQLMPATGCVNPVDVPWLSVSPASGMTAPGNSSDIDVTVDTTGLLPDTYEAEVCVLTDDSRTPIIGVPVTLTVDAPASFGTLTGNVESLGYCSNDPQPAAGATVEVVGQNSTFTATTDANGDYTLVFDSAESPVDVTASFAGHFDGVQTGLVISAGDTTSANFSLELDAACATATPSPMSETLEPGQMATQTLTIANDGAGELNWTLDEAEPLTFVGGIEGNAGPGVAMGNADSARDMRSLYEGSLPSIEGFVGITAIDCENAPGLVIHDDGSIDNGYSGNASVVSEVAIVEYFEPAAYPASLGEVCISFVTLNTSDVDLTFEMVVFADDGPGGAPGTELGAVTATATGIPGGGMPATVPWFTADLSGLNLAIQAGGVYIGARYAPTDPGIFISADESTGTAQQTGYFQTDGGTWEELQPAGFPDYRAMFIRPQMLAAGCAAPTDVPWLSVTPTSGTTAGGSSSDVDVTADATGLTNGTYQAVLCLNSDDPQQPLIEIPYTLDVSQDLIFQDRFEQ